MYNADPAVRNSMPNVVPVLGLWHSFKHGLETLFHRHLRLLFGRVYHAILPKSKIPKHPRHFFLQTLALSLLTAWETYSRQFAEIATDEHNSQSHHAKSMCILMNYLLPKVSYVIDADVSLLSHDRTIFNIVEFCFVIMSTILNIVRCW
jgi:hypothetical protein